MEGITSKEQSWEIDGLARRVVKPCPSDKTREGSGECPEGICEGSGEIKPYAKTGIGGWLAERPCEGCGGTGQPLDIISRKEVCRGCDGSGRAGVWPSLVWADFSGRHELCLASDEQTVFPYVHALPYTLALEFLEVCYGWQRQRQPRLGYMAWRNPGWPIEDCARESELLDSMLALMGVK